MGTESDEHDGEEDGVDTDPDEHDGEEDGAVDAVVVERIRRFRQRPEHGSCRKHVLLKHNNHMTF